MWYLFGLDRFGRPICEDRDIEDFEYEDLSDSIDKESCYV